MLLALWAYSFASAVGNGWSTGEHYRGLELTISHHGSECSFVTIEPYHSQTELNSRKSHGQPRVPAPRASWLADGEELATFHASDEDSLWARVQSVCGGSLQLKCTQEIARSVDQEAISLKKGTPVPVTSVTETTVESVPLEILSLYRSGSPTNRADFVFFSDGCEPNAVVILTI
jgi:hypothetical protein